MNKLELKKSFNLVIIYALIILGGIPAARYLLIFEFGVFPNWKDTFVLFRVFMSAPILIIFGGLLFLKNNKLYHRIIGLLVMITGVFWLFYVISGIINEAV